MIFIGMFLNGLAFKKHIFKTHIVHIQNKLVYCIESNIWDMLFTLPRHHNQLCRQSAHQRSAEEPPATTRRGALVDGQTMKC